MARTLPRLAAAFVLALAVLGVAAACSSGPKQHDPKLPAGFLDTPVPDVALTGYIYVSPTKTMSAPVARFLTPEQVAALPAGSPREVAARRVALYLGPTPEHVAAAIDLADARTAASLEQQLLAQGKADRIVARSGDRLFIISKTDDWGQSIAAAIKDGKTVKFQDAYSGAWSMMRYLPAKPSVEPVGVGFVTVDEAFLAAAGRTGAVDIGQLGSALDFAKVATAAFTFNTDGDLRLPGAGFPPSFLKEQGVGLIAVTKSGLPGFIVGIGFGSFAGQAGLEKTKAGEEEVYRRALNGIEVVVKAKSSVLFMAMAPDAERARGLVLSALAKPEK